MSVIIFVTVLLPNPVKFVISAYQQNYFFCSHFFQTLLQRTRENLIVYIIVSQLSFGSLIN